MKDNKDQNFLNLALKVKVKYQDISSKSIYAIRNKVKNNKWNISNLEYKLLQILLLDNELEMLLKLQAISKEIKEIKQLQEMKKNKRNKQ